MLPVMRQRRALARGQPIAMLPILMRARLSNVNGTALRIARDTGPRAGYQLSMALARINFLERFAISWQLQEHKEERCPAPLGDCASQHHL